MKLQFYELFLSIYFVVCLLQLAFTLRIFFKISKIILADFYMPLLPRIETVLEDNSRFE